MISLRFFPLKSADVRGEGTRDARLRMSAGKASVSVANNFESLTSVGHYLHERTTLWN